MAAAVGSSSPAASQAAPRESPQSQPQKSMKLSALRLPELQSSSSKNATDGFDADIAALLKEASANFAPMQLPEAATPVFPLLQEVVPSESSQTVGVASSSSAVSSSRIKANKGTKYCEEGDAQSDNTSDASTSLCQSTVRPTLDRRGSSSMWWLPSNSSVLSFASCMAA